MSSSGAAEAEHPTRSQATLPRHIAIIMDGNGRWAMERGKPRSLGHHAGVEALRKTVRHAALKQILYLTVFAFSSENWTRPSDEISDLLSLLRRFISQELASLHRENIRIHVIGEEKNLPTDVLALLKDARELTKENTGLQLVVALNYGGRQEIAYAAQQMATAVAAGTLKAEDITPELFAGYLLTKGIPDPDLIIRTSGEQRLSNFLLWQLAYAEFIFSPVLWPDFSEAHLDQALDDFANRERRYGGLSAYANG